MSYKQLKGDLAIRAKAASPIERANGRRHQSLGAEVGVHAGVRP